MSPLHPLLRHNIPNITNPMKIANCVLHANLNKENSANRLLDSNILYAYNSQSRQLKNHLACNSIICSLDILFWIRTDLSAIFGCDIFPLT